MTETAKLSLPLLSPSQAQKHVTVNEALGRLDAMVQLSVASRSVTTPPLVATHGDTYLVPGGAVNEWAGQEGNIAVFQNNGWLFIVPKAGWRAYVIDEGVQIFNDGNGWGEGTIAIASGGSAFTFHVNEFDHDLGAGATSTTGFEIAADSVVFGITGRVMADITGTLSDWRLGISGSDDRYGSSLGTLEGSWLRGLTGSPLAYYSPTELVLTADGGTFDGNGTVRLAVHYAMLGLPRPL